MKFVAAGSFRAGYSLYTGIDRVTLGKIVIYFVNEFIEVCSDQVGRMCWVGLV